MKINKSYYIKKLLIDIVYPNRCPFCGEIIPYNEYYHGECLKGLNILNEGAVVSVCRYDEDSKKFIYKAKENGNGYAVSAAAGLLYEKLSGQGLLENIDIVTAIPAKKASLKKRGYCFPSLMAREIAELAGLPFNGKLLFNLNINLPQKELTAAERRKNMKGAFALGKRDIKDLRVLLIDDVYVTGATLCSAEDILFEAGAADVVKAAFART